MLEAGLSVVWNCKSSNVAHSKTASQLQSSSQKLYRTTRTPLPSMGWRSGTQYLFQPAHGIPMVSTKTGAWGFTWAIQTKFMPFSWTVTINVVSHADWSRPYLETDFIWSLPILQWYRNYLINHLTCSGWGFPTLPKLEIPYGCWGPKSKDPF